MPFLYRRCIYWLGNMGAGLFVCLVTLLAALAQSTPENGTRARQYGFQIVHVYPHDRSSFTQGLEYRSGVLYEGTGLQGRSALRKEDLETGRVLQSVPLPAQLFGEGITVMDNRIFQLTWQSHTGFIYDQVTLRKLGTFAYAGEGWGLANDGKRIYMSDGSSQLRVWDPQTLTERRRITVHDGAQPVEMLNELECVRGEIYANVWHSDQIARIAPEDGSVAGWIDLSHLSAEQRLEDPEAVLNGIAYDAAADRLFVTGKLWPNIFEIRLVAR